MAIMLTKNLKRIITRQFKEGDPMIYLAKLYEVSESRIEQVIREALNNSEESGVRGKERDEMPGANALVGRTTDY